jgi:hypothetical protein
MVDAKITDRARISRPIKVYGCSSEVTPHEVTMILNMSGPKQIINFMKIEFKGEYVNGTLETV